MLLCLPIISIIKSLFFLLIHLKIQLLFLLFFNQLDLFLLIPTLNIFSKSTKHRSIYRIFPFISISFRISTALSTSLKFSLLFLICKIIHHFQLINFIYFSPNALLKVIYNRMSKPSNAIISFLSNILISIYYTYKSM